MADADKDVRNSTLELTVDSSAFRPRMRPGDKVTFHFGSSTRERLIIVKKGDVEDEGLFGAGNGRFTLSATNSPRSFDVQPHDDSAEYTIEMDPETSGDVEPIRTFIKVVKGF